MSVTWPLNVLPLSYCLILLLLFVSIWSNRIAPALRCGSHPKLFAPARCVQDLFSQLLGSRQGEAEGLRSRSASPPLLRRPLVEASRRGGTESIQEPRFVGEDIAFIQLETEWENMHVGGSIHCRNTERAQSSPAR